MLLLRTIFAHRSQFLNSSILRHWSAHALPAININLSSISFRNKRLQKYLETLRLEFYESRTNPGNTTNKHARLNLLSVIVKALEEHRVLQGNISSDDELKSENDAELRDLIEEENQVYSKLMKMKEEQIISQLLNLTDDETYPSVIFEVSAGTGGQEAMLFANELYEMYLKYFEHKGWSHDVINEDLTDIGGLRYANVLIDNGNAYSWLHHEAGIHRVQRIPATEKSGRVHTSTASITVIPRPADVVIQLDEKDLRIETKRASGAGGQHVNTTDSAVRVVHLPTGTIVESQSDRSQLKNKEIALRRLQAKLERLEIDRIDATKSAAKKSQQGNKNRNEKIRTYNFAQDRITDHRIQDGTLHKLEDFFKGTQHLNRLIERLIVEERKSKFIKILENVTIEEDIKKPPG